MSNTGRIVDSQALISVSKDITPIIQDVEVHQRDSTGTERQICETISMSSEANDTPPHPDIELRQRRASGGGGKQYETLCDATRGPTEETTDIKETDQPEIAERKQTSIRKAKLLRPSRKLEKSTFMFTSAFMVYLSHAVLGFQWMLPYTYILLTPFVIGVRLSMYWKKQWQHFMLDFCYYVNILCVVFLCSPDDHVLFSVMYSLSTGPLVWAVLVYQKSLVLHRIDKVTSTYLHMLPALLSFVIRWYPKEASRYWFRDFVLDSDDLDLTLTFTLPFSAFLGYSILYAFVDNFLWDHSDATSVSRRREDANCDAVPHSLWCCVDERCRCLMFYIRVWGFGLVTMIGCQLCLYSYTANYICLAIIGLVVVWNGGSYYVHIFSVKGFAEEKDDPKLL